MIFPAGNPKVQAPVLLAPPTARALPSQLVEWVCFRVVDGARKLRIVL